MDCYHKKGQTENLTYVFGVGVWQVPMKHAIMPLFVLITLTSANMKGFYNPSCTEKTCAPYQGTKKEVVPKRITDL